MIEHKEFRNLRLKCFFPSLEVDRMSDWEFMARMWHCESIGFTQWLSPLDNNSETEYISLELDKLPKEETKSVIEKIGLEVWPGMTSDEIKTVYGEPMKELNFVKDRATYEYEVGNEEKYDLSFTALYEGGLVYFGMMLKE